MKRLTLIAVLIFIGCSQHKPARLDPNISYRVAVDPRYCVTGLDGKTHCGGPHGCTLDPQEVKAK